MNELKRHAPFWLLIYIVWSYIKTNGGGVRLGPMLVVNLFNIAVYMAAYYTLKHIFIPRLFNHKKYFLFVVSIILTSLMLHLFMFVNDIIWFHKLGNWEPTSFSFSNYLQKAIQYYSPAMILLAWETQMNSIKEQKRIQELENEKLSTELKYLKAQLNPHFLFNTLNNLYSEVITHSERAPDMILQLSGILDYVLYKSQDKTVALKDEIAVINDFLALEKIRYGDRLELHLDVQDNALTPISPLLFLSLVENAFKHGVRKGIDLAVVKIEIKEKEDGVYCKVWNSKSEYQDLERDDYREGLGLSNIKRQLNITYPNLHTIDIVDKEKEFCVEVSIKTSYE